MKKPASWKANWAGFFIVLILIALAAMSIPSHYTRQAAQTESFQNMQAVASALRAFSIDHGGSLPHRFAELVPDYLAVADPLFVGPRYSHSFVPGDVASHPELIDLFSPYSFLKIPDGRIVVAERPGLWDDGKISLVTLGNNGKSIGDQTACRVAPEKFEERLKSDFSGSPALDAKGGASKALK